MGVRPLFIIILLFGQFSVAKSTCDHDEKNFRCVKYVRNYDADTITVDIPNVHPLIGKNISVRVRHVDTPEMKGKLPCEKQVAKDAQKYVQQLLVNAKRIDLTNIAKDKYFRILADVVIDGKNLGSELIQNRLAYAYDGGTKSKVNWCDRLPAGSRGAK